MVFRATGVRLSWALAMNSANVWLGYSHPKLINAVSTELIGTTTTKPRISTALPRYLEDFRIIDHRQVVRMCCNQGEQQTDNAEYNLDF
jgi:hypothetical protein